MELDSLKHTLRQLKKQERRIRFGGPDAAGGDLVWDAFFSMREDASPRYPLRELLPLSPEQLREIIGEYFCEVYLRLYRESGAGGYFDPALLGRLGLRSDAGEQEVRKRFRALAKRLHPDCGGDSEQFIELMEIYRRLRGERKG